MTGIELIAKEREEQLSRHGFSVQEDQRHNSEFQLMDAAITLAEYPDENAPDYVPFVQNLPPGGWDTERWNKMAAKSYKERLIIAGALLAAEIDRIS